MLVRLELSSRVSGQFLLLPHATLASKVAAKQVPAHMRNCVSRAQVHKRRYIPL